MKLRIEIDTNNPGEIGVKVDGKKLDKVDRITIDFDTMVGVGRIRQTVAPEQFQTTSFRALGGKTEIDVK